MRHGLHLAGIQSECRLEQRLAVSRRARACYPCALGQPLAQLAHGAHGGLDGIALIARIERVQELSVLADHSDLGSRRARIYAQIARSAICLDICLFHDRP